MVNATRSLARISFDSAAYESKCRLDFIITMRGWTSVYCCDSRNPNKRQFRNGFENSAIICWRIEPRAIDRIRRGISRGWYGPGELHELSLCSVLLLDTPPAGILFPTNRKGHSQTQATCNGDYLQIAMTARQKLSSATTARRL